MHTYYDDLISLALGDSDFKCAKEFKEAFLDIVSFNLYGYTNLNKDFYNAIISWYRGRHNIEIKASNILYIQSIALALDICVRNLTCEGDEIIINTPLFTPLCDAISLNNRNILKSPLVLYEDNRFHFDFEHIKSLINNKTKMFVLTSPHNPTTRVWSKEELEYLYKICVEHEIILFVVEIYSDIIKNNINFYSSL